MSDFNWVVFAPIAAVVIVIGTIICKVGIWAGNVNSDRSSFKEFMEEIRTNIKSIQEDIKKIFHLIPAVISSESPLKLTDLGRSISSDVNADKWAAEKAVGLVDKFLDKHPYEIQEFCFEFVEEESNYSPEMISKMKMSSYNHGIEMKHVKRALAVELRDVLLKKLNLDPP